jgi:uncharacterized protein YdiU (UPF0061 family)
MQAMHALGVPTTRAGTVISSDTTVVRDMFYDGRAKSERCAVITRIAPTFIRFGSFEIAKLTDPRTGRAGPSPGRTDIIAKLADFVLDSHMPGVVTDPTLRYTCTGTFLHDVCVCLHDVSLPVAALVQRFCVRSVSALAVWLPTGNLLAFAMACLTPTT